MVDVCIAYTFATSVSSLVVRQGSMTNSNRLIMQVRVIVAILLDF